MPGKIKKTTTQTGSYTWLIYWLSLLQASAFFVLAILTYFWWQYVHHLAGLVSVVVLLLAAGGSVLIARRADKLKRVGAWLMISLSFMAITVANIVWGTGTALYFYFVWVVITSALLLNYSGVLSFSVLSLLSYGLTLLGEAQHWVPLSLLPVEGVSLLDRLVIAVMLPLLSGLFVLAYLQVMHRWRHKYRNMLFAIGEKIQENADILGAQLNDHAATLHQISAAAEELSREIHHIGDHASQVTVASQRLLQDLEKGGQILGETSEALSLLGDELHAMNQAIIQMREKGESLSEMANNSQQLSREIRLIALNAALETVHNQTGSESKRLQVIVSEIKQLAQRSQSMAADSQKTADSLQSGISDFVMKAEANERDVKHYLGQVQKQKDILTVLKEGTQQTEQLASQIQEAILQQDSATRQLSAGVTNLAQNADQYRALHESIKLLADELDEQVRSITEKM